VKHHLRAVFVQERLQIGGDDIGLDEDELGIVGQMLEVGGPPRREVIQADDAVPVAQQPVD
jgi:hypothetical protein